MKTESRVPLIPYEFESEEFELRPESQIHKSKYLSFQNEASGYVLSWPLVGVSLFVPEFEYYPSLEAIEEQSGGAFKLHGLSSFSAGVYHEFFVNVEGPYDYKSQYVTFRAGAIEVSFGLATPLAAFLFEGHRSKYIGYWGQITTIRLVGPKIHEVEAILLGSFDAYQEQFGILPRLIDMDDSFIYEHDQDREEEDREPRYIETPFFTINVEPLRFLYAGLSQPDDTAACIYFYRILEYFAFFLNFDGIRQLRHDAALSDVDFSQRILTLVTRDEKGPIFKLVSTLVDEKTLAQSKLDGLIDNESANAFCESLYAFRNSIVHGKFSYGYVLQSESLLDKSAATQKWRTVLRDLARDALERYGSKRT